MPSLQLPRVLLIDDDDALRRTVGRLLAHDFRVTETATGAQAVALLAVESFDAVVTDLEMPDMCGDEVVAWLLAHQPAVAARVVVLSGGAKDPVKAEWLRTFDAERVLRKPCSAEDLLAAIRRVLASGGP